MEAEARRLVHTTDQSTGTESEDKRSTIGADRKGANMHRYNSLLDPNLTVYDLDTIEINPRILDRTLE